MSRAHLDLRYTHEMATLATAAFPAPAADRVARDLTARLRCLKALADAERAGRAGRRRVH